MRSTIRSRIGRILGPFAGRNVERIRAAVVRPFARFRLRPPRFAGSTECTLEIPAHALTTT
jgi:hypothetical protein